MLGLYECVGKCEGVEILLERVLSMCFSQVGFVNMCLCAWIYVGMLSVCVCENICEQVPTLVCVREKKTLCDCVSVRVCEGFEEGFAYRASDRTLFDFLSTRVCDCV